MEFHKACCLRGRLSLCVGGFDAYRYRIQVNEAVFIENAEIATFLNDLVMIIPI